MSRPVLSIQHLSKAYDDRGVLKDISLEIQQGEVVAIIGPSGSGKSTLLRCAALLEPMTSGEMRYGELTVCVNDGGGRAAYVSDKELQKVRRKIGFVFQSLNLFPHYSVLRNIIDAPLVVQKRKYDEVVADARRLLKKMGLVDKERFYPWQLSGGQRQRVSIVRALINNPDVLFLDEPTSALDPELTGELLKLIRALSEEHITMVIVTHEIEFARKVADRILFLAEGVVIEEGPADQVIQHPKNERTQLFLARMNEK